MNHNERLTSVELLGVDTGGTFTDFVFYKNGLIKVHKVLSTPHAPEQAILQGMKALDVNLQALKLIHGSTVATNAVLESKGVKTVYVTNYGLKDVLHIGRQARRELYNLQPAEVEHPLNRNLCLETGGRLSAQGEVIEALSEAEIALLLSQIEKIQPCAVAINLLFSFLNPVFEQRLKAVLPQRYFVSCSSDILPEYKEYERGMTTWLNAYVGPLVEQYLTLLGEQIKPARLSVMLSAGSTASVEFAANKAVHMLLSGPAGGLQAAKYIGQQINQTQLLTLDMGGTSTDVALIEGDFKLSGESSIADLPVAVPMVEMHTIGAGGGSIAQVDAGGLLQVGPASAGASPGPACYKNGGTHATVTDANVVLGRIPVQAAMAGALDLDLALAKTAIEVVAKKMSCSLMAAASGIIKIANEHMAQALRVISIQKGVDPRSYTLMSFGGAGGLHVCDLAEIMGMSKVVVPINAGVLSAFGMLVAPVGRELSATFIGVLERMSQASITEAFEKLSQKGLQEMQDEGVPLEAIEQRYSVDLRYCGQSFTLTVPWQRIEQCIAAFHATHERQYGHKLKERVELVNIRLSLKAPAVSLNWHHMQKKSRAKPKSYVAVHALGERVPVWQREDLQPGSEICGPALVLESVTTTWIKAKWIARTDKYGHLIMQYAG
ncbi:MAG TPA: hydantoinase/oxoprolinase family protein [Gammaproteobacteria bacterium]|nr:hydantoinase/oxoprolinase family protein [Gammaproteobacteria bacterium]